MRGLESIVGEEVDFVFRFGLGERREVVRGLGGRGRLEC